VPWACNTCHFRNVPANHDSLAGASSLGKSYIWGYRGGARELENRFTIVFLQDHCLEWPRIRCGPRLVVEYEPPMDECLKQIPCYTYCHTASQEVRDLLGNPSFLFAVQHVHELFRDPLRLEIDSPICFMDTLIPRPGDGSQSENAMTRF